MRVRAEMPAPAAETAARSLEAIAHRRRSARLEVDPHLLIVIEALRRARPMSDVGQPVVGDPAEPSPWMTTAEFAQLHGLTDRTVRRWAAAGSIRARQTDGGGWLIEPTQEPPT